MKQIYTMAAAIFFAGSLTAQISQQTTTVKTDKQESFSTVKASIEGSDQTVNQSNNNSQVIIYEHKKVNGKVVISKEEFKNMSDRSKDYVLARPDKYMIEEQ